MLEGDFYDYDFKHIKMDPSIEDHYRRCRHEKNYKQKSFVYNYNEFPQFLSELDFVITSYSTMGIESLTMGKPVMLTAFPDPTFHYSFDKLELYEHHNCWEKYNHIVVCEDFKNLLSAFNDCSKMIRNSAVEQELKEQVKFVAYADEKTYSERLLR